MIVYLTTETKTVVKRCGVNQKLASFINADDITKKMGYDSKDMIEVSKFIVNQEIISAFECASKSKRFYSIVYQVPSIKEDVVDNIKNVFKDIKSDLSKIVLIDTKNKYVNMYDKFDDVITKPIARKINVYKVEVYSCL